MDIYARGAKLPPAMLDVMLEAGYDSSTTETGAFVMVFDDRDLTIARSGLFQAGTKTRPGSPLDWGGSKMEVRAVSLSPAGLYTVEARPLSLCKLKRAFGVSVMPDISPTEWVRKQADMYGIKFVGQPTPTRHTITRGDKDSSWDVIRRLADEVGFLAFEAGGILYFGQPGWLSRVPGSRVIDVSVGADGYPLDPRVLDRPEWRTTGDDEARVGTLTVRMLPALGWGIMPGHTLAISGATAPAQMRGGYMVDRVAYNILHPDSVMDITAVTTLNPTPTADGDPSAPTPPVSTAPAAGYTWNDARGWIGGAPLRAPAAGRYGLVTLNSSQVGVAVEIVRQGIKDRIKPRGIASAIACGMQESSLRNLNWGDRDSIGVFQQRDAWASRASRLNVGESAHRFWFGGNSGQRGLYDIRGWENMEFGAAIQAVQVSAHPREYSKWEAMSYALMNAILGTAKTAPSPAPSGGPTAEAFVTLCQRQAGDRYIYGYEVKLSDPDPDAFDCSELVEWGCYQLGVSPRMPDGSWAQEAHCKKHGKLISVAQATRTRGALLFRPGHVAVSLGDGRTIEAKGRAYGVLNDKVAGRGFTTGGLIPGMRY